MLKNIARRLYRDSDNRLMGKFSLLQFFFWSTWALYGGFSVYYLTDIGYTNMEIGTIMSLRTFTGIIGPPILGYICDKFKTRKTVFIIGMVLLGLMVVPFPLYNKLMIMVMTAGIGFIWAPQQSILDSWILETSDKIADNYGFMRAWGSLGFAFCVAIFGKVIERFGWTIHYLSYGIVVMIVVVISLLIRDNSYSSRTAQEEVAAADSPKEVETPSPLILFKNVEYVFILIFTVMVFIPIEIIFIYLAPIIREAGGNAEVLGNTLFFNAFSEAGILFVSRYFLKKFRVKVLLLVSGFFYLLRIIIVSQASSPIYFIIFGLLHSLSFGIFLAATRYYVNIIAPKGLKTTAQSIVLTFAFGIGGIVASLLGGFLIDTYGMGVMFSYCIYQASFAVLLWLGFIFFDMLKD